MGTFPRTCLASLVAFQFLIGGFALAAEPAVKRPAAQRTPATKGAGTGVLASTKQAKYLPNRAEALRSQIVVRDTENAVALSARNATATVAQSAQGAPRGGFSKAQVPSGTVFKSPPPGIWFVNKKEANFVLTPGGYVTILGKGFGDTIGRVSMFVNNEYPLRVVNWRDDEIYALLPAGIRGVADQPARLQVITSASRTYMNDRGRFYATREEITLGTSLGRAIDLQADGGWAATLADNGRVDRVLNSDVDTRCASPGRDVLYFRPLPNGFVLTGVSWWTGRTDSGDGDMNGAGGSRVFTPGYSFGEWGSYSRGGVVSPNLPVFWGVFRSHSSRQVAFGDILDHCESSYQVELTVSGPAGLRPF